MLIADISSNRIRMIAATSGTFYGVAVTAGDLYTVAGAGTSGFAGDGGPATAAELSGPEAVAVDGAGNLVISDTGNQRIRLVAAASGTFYGQAMTAGDIYTVAGNGRFEFSGDGSPATAAGLRDPQGVTVDPSGNLVIADSFDNRVRVVAATPGTFYGVAMTTGDIYTVAGNGTAAFAGDGGPATAAELFFPNATIVDGAGNLVIADFYNNRARVVAATSGSFYGQAMTAGHIYTVAGTGAAGYSGDGGPATAATLRTPTSVTADAAGNLLIADSANNRIRAVAATPGSFYGQAMTAGDIYTVAGNGTYGFAGDGGPAASAELRDPMGVSFDGSGNLLISDTNNERVRLVAAASGSYLGQAVSAGDIVTVAGNGTTGFLGDSGPAVHARLDFPRATAVDGTGSLLIVDGDNGRIRKVGA